MSIAEKLTAVAENMQKVFDAGKAAGGEDLTKYAYVVRFANLNIFGKPELTINLNNISAFNDIFYNSGMGAGNNNVTVKHITVNCPVKCGGAYRMFDFSGGGDLALERITLNCDFSKAASGHTFINYARKLKVVDGTPLDFSSMPANVTLLIGYCELLEEIRFVPNTMKMPISFPQSSKLSAETIQSIIDGLADLTGQTTKTVSFHASVGARLTEEQKAAITAKNWTLAY